MAKYVYKPVEVEAFKITAAYPIQDNETHMEILVEGIDKPKCATPEMTVRYVPVPGDYWVVQPDGYEYINPKDVFERKFNKKYEPHQERVLLEKEVLDEKIRLLKIFVVSEKFKTIDNVEQMNLEKQLEYMEKYSEILSFRIQGF